MTKIILTATAFFSVLSLTACGEETYTTDYLTQNDDIRSQVLADCALNKQSDENCENANEAESNKAADDYWNQALK